MAYISTEEVAAIRANFKNEFPKSEGWKFSIRNDNHSGVDVALIAGTIKWPEHDSFTFQINHYHYKTDDRMNDEQKAVVCRMMNCITEIKESVDYNAGDMGADYPNYNFYIDLQVGRWDKPYQCIEQSEAA